MIHELNKNHHIDELKINNIYVGPLRNIGSQIEISDVHFYRKNEKKVENKNTNMNSDENDDIYFVLQFENGEFYAKIKKIMSKIEIDILSKLIDVKKEMLLKCANQYLQNERTKTGFLYDVIALIKSTMVLDLKNQKELIEKGALNSLQLFHNRLQAEIHQKLYMTTKIIFPKCEYGKSTPDMKINGIKIDVKTLLYSNISDDELIEKYIERFEKILEENKQIGTSGTFFIGIGSGYIASVIKHSYMKFKKNAILENVKLTNQPHIEKEKVIFVLPTNTAFENEYLHIDRSCVSQIFTWILKTGECDIMNNGKDFERLLKLPKGIIYGVPQKGKIQFEIK